MTELPAHAGEDRAELMSLLDQNFTSIISHGKRASAIVRSMLRHSRGGAGIVEAVNVETLTRASVTAALGTSPARDQARDVEIAWDVEPDLPEARMVQQDIAMVIDNLMRNAVYAVDSRRQAADPVNDADWRPCVTLILRRDGDSVAITVRDNGTGIPESARAKLYTPFFTTKPSGEGTGLGLSLSFDIVVKRHRGQFDIDSVPGAYTAVTIALPIIGPMA
jgi:signal transduction histidine kinase